MDQHLPHQICVPLSTRISLCFPKINNEEALYPSGRIQKGLILLHNKKDISEEGVGLGVPILKRGYKTIYPGSAQVHTKEEEDRTVVSIKYDLNIHEKAYIKGKPVLHTSFYRIHEWLSRLHRQQPFLREFLKSSGVFVKKAIHLRFNFEEGVSCGSVSVDYGIEPQKNMIIVDLNLTEISSGGQYEACIMNELGANYFDTYHDSNGSLLCKECIGTWDEVQAEEATLVDTKNEISISLEKIDGAKMYRGREFLPGKLAWAGIAYELPKNTLRFTYSIKIRDEASF